MAIVDIVAIVTIVAIEVIGYIVVAELPLRGIEGHCGAGAKYCAPTSGWG